MALIELSGGQTQDTPLQVDEICRRQGIRDRYLEQILTSLRTAGLLHSIRGRRGGYRLARHPAEISVAEVVGSLEPAGQPEPQGDRATTEFGVVASLGGQVEQARARLLGTAALQQLLDEREARRQPPQMFSI